MLLVLVALCVGVVLAGVALTSRQPATRIGQNACDDASARWGAHAAAGYAEAILETAVDCVDYASTNAGGLIQTFPIEGGTASVRLTRPDGTAPQPGDRELLMTAVATVGSVSATVEKIVNLTLPVSMNVAADMRLGEFALFANSSLTIEDDAVVDLSPAASSSGLSVPLKVGIAIASTFGVNVGSDADLENVGVYLGASAPVTLDSLLGDSRFCTGERIPYDIPLVREAPPAQVATLPVLAATIPTYTGGASVTTLAQGNYSDLNVQDGAEVTIGQAGQTTVYKVPNLNVNTSGVLRYAGHVLVQVSAAFRVQSLGTIEPVDADSKIFFYIARNVTIDNGAVGLPRAVGQNSARNADDLASHPPADSIRLAPLSIVNGGSLLPIWTICTNSLVVGSIHAPQSLLEIKTNSTLIGRATAGALTIRSGCAILYDPSLDCRAGFTAFDGPLYLDELPFPAVETLFAAASYTAGTALIQSNLETALATLWAAEPEGNPMLDSPRVPSGTIVADPEEVVLNSAGPASPRAKGKSKHSTKAARAEEFED